MMMEQQQKHGSVSCDRLPSPSAKYPWLVVQNGEDDFGDQIFYNLHNPLSQYRYQIPELVGRRIRGVFHGWMILSSNVMWSLWNPSTSKVIRLPPLNILKDGDSDDDIIRECCLTSPPDDPGSILVLTRTDKSTFVFCQLECKRKRLRWTEMSYAKQLKRITSDGRLLHSLACCNGKVYALNTDGCLFPAIIIIDIVVKNKEVVIKLLLFGSTPCLCIDYDCEGRYEKLFLKGSSTMLFCVVVAFVEHTEKTICAVTLFELETTTIKWEEIHSIYKKWDVTDESELDDTDINELAITSLLWEEMSDLKDATFFVDLARDHSVFYLPGIASELGDYIHIRGKTGKIMYSYHMNDKTLSQSYMPSLVLSTSHVSLWEVKGLKGDYKQEEEEDKADEIMIRSVTDDEVEFNESHLLNVPFHLLESVMKHCVGVEYMKFRATCKRCHLAAPLIRWKDKSGLTRLQNYSLVSPWLMAVDKEEEIITFTDPLFGDKYFMYCLPEKILNKRIYCSRFGWLLFHNHSTLVFYNPFTSDIRKLPPIHYWLSSFSFSAPPTSPDCMVVGFLWDNDLHVYIHFVSGEFSWRRLHLDFSGADIDCFSFPTFSGRDLYALHKDELHLFKDLGGDDYSWEKDVAKAPKSCSTSWTKHFLTRHDQHLLLVVVSEESVEVFKLNGGTKTWEKIDGLGRYMIYICAETCLCLEAKTPEMGNKIYFPKLHSNNGRIVFYSLETCTYGTFNRKTIQETHTIVTQLHNIHTWIEPSWS